MTAFFHITTRNNAQPNLSEKIRREWQDFQRWHATMKKEEEKKTQKLCDELSNKTKRRKQTQDSRNDPFSDIQKDEEKERRALQNQLEREVTSRARDEWHGRLSKAGLSIEQWTDVTIAENSALSSLLWGRNSDDSDDSSPNPDSSDTSSITSSDATPTPSLSSRGPQLWTPPEFTRTADLPPPTSAQTGPGQGHHSDGETTPTADTATSFWSRYNNTDTVTPPTPLSGTGGRLRRNTVSATPTLQGAVSGPGLEHAAHTSTIVQKQESVRQSWSDDSTLLAPSNDVSDAEADDTETEAKLKAPAYRRVPIYTQWQTAQTDTPVKGDSEQTLKKIDNNAKPAFIPKAPSVPKESARLPAIVPTKPIVKTETVAQPAALTRPQLDARSKSKTTTSAAQPSKVPTVAKSTIEPDAEFTAALRKHIEESLRPTVTEAQQAFAKNRTSASSDPEALRKITKEHNDTLAHTRKLAEDMFQDGMEVERQRLRPVQTGMGAGEITKGRTDDKPVIVEQSYKQGNDQKRSDSTTRSSQTPQGVQLPQGRPRALQVPKPLPPLTPPQTPRPGLKYIGPVLTEEEKAKEGAAFNDFALAARKQKIIEYHEAAATMEVALADRLHNHRMDKIQLTAVLKLHDEDMEELKRVKDQERKEMCDVERGRRQAEIATWAQNARSDQRDDGQIKQSNQLPRSDSKSKKEQHVIPEIRANEDPSRVETIRQNVTANHTTNQQTKRVDYSRRHTSGVLSQGRATDTYKDARLDVETRAASETRAGSPRMRMSARSEVTFGPNTFTRMTPTTPSTFLPKAFPELASDDEMSAPEVGDRRRVQFNVDLYEEDSDSNSSDSERTFGNSLGLGIGPGFEPGFSKLPSSTLQRLDGIGSGANRKKRPVNRKVEQIPEIWYPQGDDDKGKHRAASIPGSPLSYPRQEWP